MSETKYKLMYFNFRGRAEVIRWIFEVAEVPYEDFRFEMNEWPEFKLKTLFGQLPVLEVDGTQLCQTVAIARFLATKFGLVGETPLECARGDMVVDTVTDFMNPIVAISREKDEEKRKQLIEQAQTDTVPKGLSQFEQVLKQRCDGDKYMLGEKMTWVDLFVTTYLTGMATFTKDFGMDIHLEKYPKLQFLFDRVQSHPRIASWIERRPQTSR